MADDGFSKRLQEAMEQRGLKGAEVAKRVGVTPGAVSGWITGRKRPKRERAAELAAALDVDVAWLERGEGTGPPLDLEKERAAYLQATDWRFRPLPEDRGRDFGNANIWALSPKIETFVREVGQNIGDVIRDQSAEVVFRLMRLRGPLLERFKQALGWKELERHLEDSAKRGQKFGRHLAEGLRQLSEDEELLVLRIEERGTEGLTGPEFGEKANFPGLCRNNLDSGKGEGSGGAYGLGKAALWRTSSLSTVLFNSDLAVPEDGKQEGRLIGRSELSFHEVDDGEFAGPGWFGEREGNNAESVWGNRALAVDLCLERAPGSPGTSILVLGFHDPTAEEPPKADQLADQLEEAIAEHFWPALESGRLEMTVEVADGPADDDVVRSARVEPSNHVPEFADLFCKHEEGEISEALEEEGDVAQTTVSLKIPGRKDGEHGPLEHEAVVLVRRAPDEPGDEDSKPDRVAFFRGHGMVIRYRDMANIRVGARPFHAAVLCGRAAGGTAEEAAEEFLKLAEPPEHNRWELTTDLAAVYERGSGAAIDEFMSAVKEAVKDLVGPASQDLSDGPIGLKKLLRITGGSDEPQHPRVTKAAGEIDDEGRWCVEATLTVKLDGKGKWSGEPVVLFEAETGGGKKVDWEVLEAVSNCTVEDGRLSIHQGKRQATFAGKTKVGSHPVPAKEAAISVEFRKATRVKS